MTSGSAGARYCSLKLLAETEGHNLGAEMCGHSGSFEEAMVCKES